MPKLQDWIVSLQLQVDQAALQRTAASIANTIGSAIEARLREALSAHSKALQSTVGPPAGSPLTQEVGRAARANATSLSELGRSVERLALAFRRLQVAQSETFRSLHRQASEASRAVSAMIGTTARMQVGWPGVQAELARTFPGLRIPPPEELGAIIQAERMRQAGERLRARFEGLFSPLRVPPTAREAASALRVLAEEAARFRLAPETAFREFIRPELIERTRQLAQETNRVRNAWETLFGIVPEGLNRVVRKVLQWAVATAAVYGTLRSIREATQFLREVELATIEVAKVMREDVVQAAGGWEEVQRRLREQAIGLAIEFGANTKDVLLAMREWARQGKNVEEMTVLTRTALVAQNIAEMDVVQATRYLTAAMGEFQLQTSQAMSILDAWNELSNKSSATTADIAEAVRRFGNVARQTGMDIQFANALATTALEVTRDTAERVGTAFRTMLVRMTRPETIRALQREFKGLDAVLVKMDGTMGSSIDVLAALAAQWNTLSEQQRLRVTQILAETRQTEFLLAIMNNWGKVMEKLSIQMSSAGSAMQENQRFMQAWAIQIGVARAEVQQALVYLDQFARITDVGSLTVRALGSAFADFLRALAPIVWTLARLSEVVASLINLFGSFLFGAAGVYAVARGVRYLATTLATASATLAGLSLLRGTALAGVAGTVAGGAGTVAAALSGPVVAAAVAGLGLLTGGLALYHTHLRRVREVEEEHILQLRYMQEGTDAASQANFRLVQALRQLHGEKIKGVDLGQQLAAFWLAYPQTLRNTQLVLRSLLADFQAAGNNQAKLAEVSNRARIVLSNMAPVLRVLGVEMGFLGRSTAITTQQIQTLLTVVTAAMARSTEDAIRQLQGAIKSIDAQMQALQRRGETREFTFSMPLGPSPLQPPQIRIPFRDRNAQRQLEILQQQRRILEGALIDLMRQRAEERRPGPPALLPPTPAPRAPSARGAGRERTVADRMRLLFEAERVDTEILSEALQQQARRLKELWNRLSTLIEHLSGEEREAVAGILQELKERTQWFILQSQDEVLTIDLRPILSKILTTPGLPTESINQAIRDAMEKTRAIGRAVERLQELLDEQSQEWSEWVGNLTDFVNDILRRQAQWVSTALEQPTQIVGGQEPMEAALSELGRRMAERRRRFERIVEEIGEDILQRPEVQDWAQAVREQLNAWERAVQETANLLRSRMSELIQRIGWQFSPLREELAQWHGTLGTLLSALLAPIQEEPGMAEGERAAGRQVFVQAIEEIEGFLRVLAEKQQAEPVVGKILDSWIHLLQARKIELLREIQDLSRRMVQEMERGNAQIVEGFKQTFVNAIADLTGFGEITRRLFRQMLRDFLREFLEESPIIQKWSEKLATLSARWKDFAVSTAHSKLIFPPILGGGEPIPLGSVSLLLSLPWIPGMPWMGDIMEKELAHLQRQARRAAAIRRGVQKALPFLMGLQARETSALGLMETALGGFLVGGPTGAVIAAGISLLRGIFRHSKRTADATEQIARIMRPPDVRFAAPAFLPINAYAGVVIQNVNVNVNSPEARQEVQAGVAMAVRALRAERMRF